MQLADLLVDAGNVLSSAQACIHDGQYVVHPGADLAPSKLGATEMTVQEPNEECGCRTAADPEQQEGTREPPPLPASAGGDRSPKSVGIVTQRCVELVCKYLF
jgi:hypothetical protein